MLRKKFPNAALPQCGIVERSAAPASGLLSAGLRDLFGNGQKYLLLLMVACLVLLNACQNPASTAADGITYTCPMPEDEVFSDKPGRCPKCGMDLVPVADVQQAQQEDEVQIAPAGYSCPMHPQEHSDTPGTCPICHMKLERVKTEDEPLSLSLEMLLKPANQAVVANVPMVHMAQRRENLELDAFGTVEYDPEFIRHISSRVSGRITKMFVKHRYQKIRQGQPLMEVYSPELVAAQNHYLFLLKNDADNHSLIASARERLRLLGMANAQIAAIVRNGEAAYSVTIYSTASGVIEEAAAGGTEPKAPVSVSAPLLLKEGMYLEQGQPMFRVLNPARARVVLQIFPQHQEMLRTGDAVRILPEANPTADFRAQIRQVIPYYQQGSHTLIARIPFDNTGKNLPAGSTVKAIVFTGDKTASWLPEEAVISLGLEKVVFVREDDGFIARRVKTGIVSKHLVQILEGLQQNEAVAANAGFLVDSEGFIMTKNHKK